MSSGVKGASQEGIDRTSLDLQLAGSSAPQEASASIPTDFATIAKTVPKSKSILVLFVDNKEYIPLFLNLFIPVCHLSK